MQGTLSRTLTFEASLLAPVTNEEVAKTDTSFLTCEAQGIGWQNDPSCYSCNRWSGLCLYLPDVLVGRGHNHFELGSRLC